MYGLSFSCTHDIINLLSIFERVRIRNVSTTFWVDNQRVVDRNINLTNSLKKYLNNPLDGVMFYCKEECYEIAKLLYDLSRQITDNVYSYQYNELESIIKIVKNDKVRALLLKVRNHFFCEKCGWYSTCIDIDTYYKNKVIDRFIDKINGKSINYYVDDCCRWSDNNDCKTWGSYSDCVTT